ncbi:nucleoside hydrolase, partial [Clostridium perfringens]|nr:nucleoside hydrolase [Clostridium perfringens]
MVHTSRVPVLMDVDTGVDDALAIMMAVKHEGFNLVGITTVNGNVSLEQATLNTRKVLHALNTEYARAIPVVMGADRPLLRPHFFEHHVHGRDGLGGALRDLELPPMEPRDQHAAAFIVEQAKLHAGELELIMTAPLTNLALAYRLCPELPRLVKRVVVMGGALLT